MKKILALTVLAFLLSSGYSHASNALLCEIDGLENIALKRKLGPITRDTLRDAISTLARMKNFRRRGDEPRVSVKSVYPNIEDDIRGLREWRNGLSSEYNKWVNASEKEDNKEMKFTFCLVDKRFQQLEDQKSAPPLKAPPAAQGNARVDGGNSQVNNTLVCKGYYCNVCNFQVDNAVVCEDERKQSKEDMNRWPSPLTKDSLACVLDEIVVTKRFHRDSREYREGHGEIKRRYPNVVNDLLGLKAWITTEELRLKYHQEYKEEKLYPNATESNKKRLLNTRFNLCLLRARLEYLERSASPPKAPPAAQGNAPTPPKVPPAAQVNTRVGDDKPQPVVRPKAAQFTDAQIEQCSTDIMNKQLESQGWKGSADDIAVRLGRYQKALFEGRCAGHPEAQAYLAGAEKMLSYGPASGSGASSRSGSSQSNQDNSHDKKKSKVVALAHDPKYDATQCVEVYKGPTLYGQFHNKCDFKVSYAYCVYRPEKDSWAEFFDCEGDKDKNKREGPNWLGTSNIKPHENDAAHQHTGESIIWAACKAGTGPHGVFDSQKKNIVYSCYKEDEEPRDPEYKRVP